MPRYSAAVLDALPLAGAGRRCKSPHALPPAWPSRRQTGRRCRISSRRRATGIPGSLLGRAWRWQDGGGGVLHRPACARPGLPAGTCGRCTDRDHRTDVRRRPGGVRQRPIWYPSAQPRPVRSVQTAGLGTFVRWPSGAEAKLFGASTPEDVERLRAGGNRCLAYAEELAAWRFLDPCWDHLQFGLRLGPHPRSRRRDHAEAEAADQGAAVRPSCAVTRATTHDNPHLADLVPAHACKHATAAHGSGGAGDGD